MDQEYYGLETIIEDEYWDDNFELESIPLDNYSIEFNESYIIDPGQIELKKAIEKFHETTDESDFNEPVITKLEPDLEIIRFLPTDQPKILRYLDEK